MSFYQFCFGYINFRYHTQNVLKVVTRINFRYKYNLMINLVYFKDYNFYKYSENKKPNFVWNNFKAVKLVAKLG